MCSSLYVSAASVLGSTSQESFVPASLASDVDQQTVERQTLRAGRWDKKCRSLPNSSPKYRQSLVRYGRCKLSVSLNFT